MEMVTVIIEISLLTLSLNFCLQHRLNACFTQFSLSRPLGSFEFCYVNHAYALSIYFIYSFILFVRKHVTTKKRSMLLVFTVIATKVK